MESSDLPPAPRVTAALVIAGLWLRIGCAAGFAALSAPVLVVRDALPAGDGAALFVLAAAIAWLGWRRASALLGDETAVAPRGLGSARSDPAAA